MSSHADAFHQRLGPSGSDLFASTQPEIVRMGQNDQVPSPAPPIHSEHPDATIRSKPRKKPRLTLACEECRVRKTRCDGERPVCRACVTRHGSLANCLYQIQAPEATYSRQYVDRLEKKIRVLQSQVTDSLARPDIPKEALATPISEVSPASSSKIIDVTSRDLDVSQVGERQKMDAMGNLTSSNETNGPAVYGTSSSTASFMRQLRDAVDEKVRTPDTGNGEVSRPPEDSSQAPKPKYCSNSVAQNCVLPPRHLADSMLNYFWVQGHALYPFLSKPVFLESYQALWTGEPVLSEQTMTYCILNVIFAIVSQFSHDEAPELRETTSDMYFKRAMQLLQIEILGTGSLQLIQALLVMGMYLQSTDTPHRCWVLIGIAIRVAQGLGLHLRETSERMQSQADRELIRRIWHGCILMDRILSMTLGQPLMIGRSISDSVPLPAPIDEIYLSSEPGREGKQPDGTPSNMGFFRATLELYDILEDILLTFYPSGVCDNPHQSQRLSTDLSTSLDLNAILRIDRSLNDWLNNLPPRLVERTPIIGVTVDESFLRQANVLKLRYLHIQILLFRPVLSQLLSISRRQEITSNHQIDLQDLLALPLASKCVLAAQQIIEVTQNHQRTDGSFEPLPAWWYKVFYVYSAATVLVAARICPPLRGTITEESILSSWHNCFEILKRHSLLSKSARRCIAALEFLDQNIVTGKEHQAHTPTANLSEHQMPLNNDTYVSIENTTDFNQGAAQPYFGDNFHTSGLVESNDIGWLHSVPMDLFQYDNSHMFRADTGPFYNFTI